MPFPMRSKSEDNLSSNSFFNKNYDAASIHQERTLRNNIALNQTRPIVSPQNTPIHAIANDSMNSMFRWHWAGLIIGLVISTLMLLIGIAFLLALTVSPVNAVLVAAFGVMSVSTLSITGGVLTAIGGLGTISNASSMIVTSITQNASAQLLNTFNPEDASVEPFSPVMR